VRLTDFGLSKEGISNSSSGANSFCGTPEYLAPEILNRQGHGRAVDWWSLGALLFEMLTGLPPFYCRDREKLFEKIKKGTLEYPKYLSPKATVLLKGLLTKDPRRRLGSGPNDADDIKNQDFFGVMNWDKLMSGEVAPPWDPQINGSMDTSQFDNEFTNMPLNSPGAFQVRASRCFLLSLTHTIIRLANSFRRTITGSRLWDHTCRQRFRRIHLHRSRILCTTTTTNS
jgi:serine/threonine protein kinase